MENLIKCDNAVAAIRISSLKQGLQGDSPEAQKEQIERFAQARNINIKKFFGISLQRRTTSSGGYRLL